MTADDERALSEILTEIRALEERLHRPDIRRAADAVSLLLADDFIEFGRSGRVYDRATIVKALGNELADDSGLFADDYRLTLLSSDIALLTYRTTRRESGGPEKHTLRSSIWQHIDGRWQMRFHQGTPADNTGR